MQNRYAGDFGDYVKLALLRSLSSARRLGIAWYLYPDESHNSDGRHISYLINPERWRDLDPELFDGLRNLMGKERSVEALQNLVQVSVAAAEIIPTGMRADLRSRARTDWFARTEASLSGCDVIFADPDNGLVSDDPVRRRQLKFGKQIPLAEALTLSDGRFGIIYHHNSRFKGGHDAEVRFWLDRLGQGTAAVRSTAYSCRTFFIVNPDDVALSRIENFAGRWRSHGVRWHL